jgi:hypothetical protein
MTSTLARLSTARSVDEVVEATADFLASFPREEFGRLVPGLDSLQVRDAADIEAWADRLQHDALLAARLAEDDAKVERLLSHFLIASVRLRQVDAARLHVVSRQ